MINSIGNRKKRHASKGITLLEVALSMAIFSVLSVAIAGLLTSGMNAQMAYRAHEYQQSVASNIVDALRMDLMTANRVDITAAGQGLQVRDSTGTITSNWLIGGTFNPPGCANVSAVLRNGQPIGISPAPCNMPMTITCGGAGAPACFEGFDQDGNPATTNAKHIILHELAIANAVSNGSPIDREFGPATYRINEFSFEILAGTTFE